MKKIILFLLILFSLCFNLYAEQSNICICPNNDELANAFKLYFDVNVVQSPIKCDVETLLTGDYRLFEYITKKTNSEFVFIPVIDQISEYQYLRLFLYNKNTNEISLEYEVINKDGPKFGFEAIKVIYDKYFNRSGIELIDKNNITYSLEKEFSNKPLTIKCSNTTADVYLNDSFIGTTPVVLDSYYSPSILRLCSEGFADKIISISDVKTNEIIVTLINEIKSNPENFKKAQNRYYMSFAGAILGWGSRIVVDALNIKNPSLNKALQNVSLGVAISSTAFLGYNIYNYFNTTKITNP